MTNAASDETNIWPQFGFRENPYTTQPINADEEGARLLVGREQELKKLGIILTSTSTLPTIEGANGVGKTSLVAVASFKALQRFRDHKTTQLLLPLPRPFQLDSQSTPSSFKRAVYLEVAQAFILNESYLKSAGLNYPDTTKINRWLNGTADRGYTIGVNTPIGGASIGTQGKLASSSGFDQSGFINQMEGWLSSCFPSEAAGGFICLIDNLEILETSSIARQLLEGLRDDLFNRKGIRFVLAGARGIIRSVASSSRLASKFADPIDLMPLPDTLVSEVVQKRVVEYSVSKTAYIPVDSKGVQHIYDVVNHSLRDTLKYCEDFSVDLALREKLPEEPVKELGLWLKKLASQSLQATNGVTPRSWKVFDEIVVKGGSISPSEYTDLGFNSQQAMRPAIKSLEDAQLVVSAVDESDQRRRTIFVTARGWIVQYERSNYNLASRAPR